MKTSLSGIYIINVKNFTDRRIFMETQLRRHNLKAQFILQWDKGELTSNIKEKFFTGKQLSDAQMSCALKHVVALETIAKQTEGFFLVLEDDAALASDFKRGLELALAESSDFPGNKVIFIGSGGNFYTPKSQRKPGQHLYIAERGRFADSYLIDPPTAAKRLEWIYENKITEPIDNQFERIDKLLDIKMLWLDNPVVEQGSKAGLFTSSLEKAPAQWLQSLLFRWEKIRRKYIYQLWK
jgi:glycosyl transferase, family 25